MVKSWAEGGGEGLSVVPDDWKAGAGRGPVLGEGADHHVPPESQSRSGGGEVALSASTSTRKWKTARSCQSP